MEHFEQLVTEFIREQFMFEHPDVELSAQLNLIEEGIIDSLGIFMLIDFIGQNFGVQIKPEQVILENFETIEAIKGMVLASA